MKITNNGGRLNLKEFSSTEKKKWAKAQYDNAVLAVRETEAIAYSSEDIDVKTTKVNWKDAVELHSNMRGGYEFYSNYMTTELANIEVADESEVEDVIQQLCIDYYMFNFAYENAVVFRLNEWKQYFEKGIKPQPLNFNKMEEFCLSIKNEDGDFVYFADTNEPIVVKGMGSNKGKVSVAEAVKNMEVA